MTPLPGPLGGSEVLAWRLDTAVHAQSWDSGEGGFIAGGRWNSRGVRAVYCAVDPATAILEVAVHKGFPALDTVPHVLTAMEVLAPARCARCAARETAQSELAGAGPAKRRTAGIRRCAAGGP